MEKTFDEWWSAEGQLQALEVRECAPYTAAKHMAHRAWDAAKRDTAEAKETTPVPAGEGVTP